jgi:hypothetical protein
MKVVVLRRIGMLYPTVTEERSSVSWTITSNILKIYHVRWKPCHHGRARLQVADGGHNLQIWNVVASILNK